ncbi:hypothetical protein BGX30_009691, partial [Mortierella sp. GBA39]
KVRPKAAREDMLAAFIANERREYASGFELPDFSSPKNVVILREWDGDLNSLNRIKMIRLNDPSYVAKMIPSAPTPKVEESSAMQE